MTEVRRAASVEDRFAGLSGGSSSFNKPNRLDLFAGCGFGASCFGTGWAAAVYGSGR